MPTIQNNSANIYWDESGDGFPLLLIHGLGYPLEMWFRIRPALAASYRTIALDNRGAGRSNAPPGPYSISLMASDAAAVLDAAGCGVAHVFGMSMGGMIAQEFTLQNPKRVQSLILGCTTAGGPRTVKSEPEVAQLLLSRGDMGFDDGAAASLPYIYNPDTPREKIDEDLDMRRPCPPSPQAYWAQLEGILSWDGYERLASIGAPTLVIHGANDRLVVPANARLLAARIPGAKLVMIPRASHNFLTDQPELAKAAILDFLATHSPPQSATNSIAGPAGQE